MKYLILILSLVASLAEAKAPKLKFGDLVVVWEKECSIGEACFFNGLQGIVTAITAYDANSRPIYEVQFNQDGYKTTKTFQEQYLVRSINNR